MYGPFDADAEDRQALDETPSLFRRLNSVFLTLGVTAAFGITIPFIATQLQDIRFRAETQISVAAQRGNTVNAAIAELSSKTALDNTIRTLNLASVEENRPTIVRVVSEVISGEVTTVSQIEEAARQRLRDSMSVIYDAAGGQVVLAAKADDPQTAAAIANQLASELRHALVSKVGDAPSPQLDAIRKAAARAEAALAGFVGKLDDQTRAKLQSLHDQRTTLDTDIVDTERRLSELEEKQKLASSMKLADVLAKPLPDSLEFTGLEYERQRYVEAELTVQQLAANLGPLHPRLIAAQGALDGARRDIGSALRQLVASLKDDLASVTKSLAELKDSKTALGADRPLNETATQLSSLHAAAEEAHQNLEKAEAASRSSAPVAASAPPILRVASPAAAERIGPDIIRLAGIGSLVGLLIGLALAARRYRRQSQLATEFEEMPVHLDLPEHALIAEPATAGGIADTIQLDQLDEGDHLLETEPAEERFAANDVAFGNHMRSLLFENRLSAKDAVLPRHVGALVDQSITRRGDERWQLWADTAAEVPDYDRPHYDEPHHDQEELLQLQRELAELRELVAEHAARQLKATG